MKLKTRKTVLSSVLLLVVAFSLGGVQEIDPWPTAPPTGLTALVNASSAVGREFEGQFCGAYRVDSSTFVTATHCLENRPPPSALTGVEDLCSGGDSAPRIPVGRVVPDRSNKELSWFSSTLESSPVAPATTVPVVTVGESVVAYGWGRLDTGGSPQCRVKEVKLVVVPLGRCDIELAAASQAGLNVKNSFCAVPVGHLNTCTGDSGGPVFRMAEGSNELVGITLLGRDCSATSPGIYGIPGAPEARVQ